MVNITFLLEKLADIERSIGVESENEVRSRVLEAQDCILQMQKEMLESLRKEPRRQILERLASSEFAA
jgi:hypothetical protein